MTMTRVQKWSIADRPMVCILNKPCVYRDVENVCDEPRTNKGNGDSACHRLANKYLIALLQEKL